MTLGQILFSKLWWGPCRRPFEFIVRHVAARSPKILVGPLKGWFFSGGLSQTLGIYEIHVQEAIIKNLVAGSVFYDVGAHTGYFSLFASNLVGKQGIVYAFEPLPENVDIISVMIAKNQARNIRVFPFAISNTDGL